MTHPVTRDFIGHVANPPDPQWPCGAALAINFVINFEEGNEPSFELSEEEERDHICQVIESPQKTVGHRPDGWYCRYGPSANTRRLVVEEGGFLYDSDYYGDESPIWTRVNERRRGAAQDDVDWAAYAPDWASRTRGRAAKFARLHGG